jgi:hypothetical protein
MEVADAAKKWFDTALDDIYDMDIDAQERDEKVAALDAELAGTLEEIENSGLFTHPESHHWNESFASQLNDRTAALNRTTAEEKLEKGRSAYYMERMKEIDPALSPAHEKMRLCWERAVEALGAVDEEASLLSEDEPTGRNSTEAKSLMWMATNFAHLADGMYADAAANFLRAGRATAVGDAEQAKCWQTAAEALMKAADDVLIWVMMPRSVYMLNEVLELDESVESVPTQFARCGVMLAAVNTAGLGSHGAVLRRALVCLTEHYVQLGRERAEQHIPQHRFSERRKLHVRAQDAIEHILDATFRAVSPARAVVEPSPLAWLVPFVAKLVPIAAELCGRFRNMWPGESTWAEDRNDQESGALSGKLGRSVRRGIRMTPEERLRADRMRAGEGAVKALETAVEAVKAGSEESAEKTYQVVQQHREAMRLS